MISTDGTATVHLVRHGEVENPKGVIYGRLPGFNLSERGRRQAAAAARHLQNEDIALVLVSPLERARETAEIIAAERGVDVEVDDRLIESETTLEGVARTLWGVLRDPRHWWHLRNPMRPSWGESFTEIERRVLAAISDALARCSGRQLVVVSHQTPLLVARHALGGRRVPPWLGLTPCQTGSVTTLVLRRGKAISANYFAPR